MRGDHVVTCLPREYTCRVYVNGRRYCMSRPGMTLPYLAGSFIYIWLAEATLKLAIIMRHQTFFRALLTRFHLSLVHNAALHQAGVAGVILLLLDEVIVQVVNRGCARGERAVI